MFMMRKLVVLAIVLMATSQAVSAKGRTSVTRTSPNHTEIVIHDTSPEAYRARRAQAKRAQARLDAKRRAARRREDERRRRAHELKVIRLKNASKTRTRSRTSTQQVARYTHHKRPSFFNGGRSTTLGFGFGNFGFGFGGFGGYGYGGFNRGFRYRGFNRGFNRGYRRGCR